MFNAAVFDVLITRFDPANRMLGAARASEARRRAPLFDHLLDSSSGAEALARLRHAGGSGKPLGDAAAQGTVGGAVWGREAT